MATTRVTYQIELEIEYLDSPTATAEDKATDAPTDTQIADWLHEKVYALSPWVFYENIHVSVVRGKADAI